MFSKQLAILSVLQNFSSFAVFDYMRTGKYVFDSDGMRLYTLCDKFSCNAASVVYQITCPDVNNVILGNSRLSSAYESAQV